MEKQLEELVICSLSQLLQVTVDKEKQVREAAAKMKGTAGRNRLKMHTELEKTMPRLTARASAGTLIFW